MLDIEKIKELGALVSLIDEPNEDMFLTIRNKVITYGKEAIPILEEAWVNTFGDFDSVRIENLIEDIRRNELETDMLRWKQNDNPDIIEGYIYLMRYLKPEYSESAFKLLFEKLYREIWLELNENLTALERVKVFNHVLFIVNKLFNVTKRPVKSETYYLSYLEEKNSANSLLLGSLYMAIAQRLNIPIFGVDLPDNFVLAYVDDLRFDKRVGDYKKDDVLFYINPGNNGAVFTHNEISHYLKKMKLSPKPEYFLPSSNKIVFARIISELIATYEMENYLTKKEGLEGIIEKLKDEAY